MAIKSDHSGAFFQLEKLLSKNYYLHQAAKDGFRSYLQSYASYSLKKIFDVNALDLAKVGKAFGFAVPPRVNVNTGGGKVETTSKIGYKRDRVDAWDKDEHLDARSRKKRQISVQSRRNKLVT